MIKWQVPANAAKLSKGSVKFSSASCRRVSLALGICCWTSEEILPVSLRLLMDILPGGGQEGV